MFLDENFKIMLHIFVVKFLSLSSIIDDKFVCGNISIVDCKLNMYLEVKFKRSSLNLSRIVEHERNKFVKNTFLEWHLEKGKVQMEMKEDQSG